MTDSPLTRRQTLIGSSIGLSALLAGCLSNGNDNGDDIGDENGDDNTGSNGDDDTGNDDTGNGEDEQFETLQGGAAPSQPAWAQADGDRPGTVLVYEQSSDLAFREEPLDNEVVSEFIDDTDFESETLLQVGTAGPNTCYTHIEFDNLEIDDDTVVGEATATTEEDVGEACGDAVNYPWAFLRVDATVSLAEFEITDGWEDTETVRSDDQPTLNPEELDGEIQPDGEPETVPEPLECDGYDRYSQISDEEDIVWGNEDDEPFFALRIDATSYEYGETATVSLTNLTTRWLTTGNKYRYNFQRQTEDGWQDVRVTQDVESIGFTDEGILHPPLEGFEWEIELTEDGLPNRAPHENQFDVCPELQSGRYRFVFWDRDLAVAFDLER